MYFYNKKKKIQCKLINLTHKDKNNTTCITDGHESTHLLKYHCFKVTFNFGAKSKSVH